MGKTLRIINGPVYGEVASSLSVLFSVLATDIVTGLASFQSPGPGLNSSPQSTGEHASRAGTASTPLYISLRDDRAGGRVLHGFLPANERFREEGPLLMTLDRRAQTQGIPSQTAAYLDYTDPWSDGWVGPWLAISREAGPEARTLLIQGWADLTAVRKPLVLSVSVDGQTIGKKAIEKTGNFILRFSLLGPLIKGLHTVDVKATGWFVPHLLQGDEDYRPLSFKLEEIRFC